jgi:hypothetical protein
LKTLRVVKTLRVAEMEMREGFSLRASRGWPGGGVFEAVFGVLLLDMGLDLDQAGELGGGGAEGGEDVMWLPWGGF